MIASYSTQAQTRERRDGLSQNREKGTHNMPIIEREWELPDKETLPDGITLTRSETGRAGATWTIEEYQVLIDAAKEDLPLHDIATTLRRTRGAITSRAKRLLPLDWERVGSSWWEDLRVIFEDDPEHPWEETLRENGELVVDYATIHEIEKLPRDKPSSLGAVETLTGLSKEEAVKALGRHGHGPRQPFVPPLRVRNLLGTDDHLPTRSHPDDAGMDLRYAGNTPITLTSAQQTLIPTGVAVSVPERHAGLICPRSGLSAKHGVTVVNGPGIIDHGYTGEVNVCLGIIGTDNEHTIHPGERIAQLVLTPIITPDIETVDALDESERGEKGFGSTGSA